MHNPKVSLSALHPDWEVTAIGPQDADPSVNAGVLTLAPRIDDGTPILYSFNDTTFQDANKDFGLVFKLALALDNNTSGAIGTFVVDLIGDVTDGQGNPAHPSYAHFHTGGDNSNGFTETGYVTSTTSAGAPLADLNPANRAVLTGNAIDPGTTETWAGGRAHQYEGSFWMIVTPVIQNDWAAPHGVDFRTLAYAFKTEHFNPTFSGTVGNDFLYGWESSANDIQGLAGHDLVMGTEGDDKLDGGAGVDRLFGGFDNDTLTGGLDADWVEGGHGLDGIDGGDGDDMLVGGWHDDTIEGGAGTDTAAFGGRLADYAVSTTGGKTTVVHNGGTEGTDTLTGVEQLKFADQTIAPPPSAPFVPEPYLLSGPPTGINNIPGTDGANTLNGTPEEDGIDGKGGNDQINGLAGDDFLFGRAGRDRVSGGEGFDYIRGGADADDLRGGPQDDRIFGDRGNDTLYGGLDHDELWGGAGNDTLYGEAGEDILLGELGDDTVDGGADADLYVFAADSGRDRAVSFDADDRIVFKGLAAGDVTVQENGGATLFSWTDGSAEVAALGLVQGTDYFFA